LPSIGVATYSVRTDRRIFPGVVVSTVSIVLEPQSAGTVSVAYLFYQTTQTAVAGYLTGSELRAYFPREALETHLRVLQSESPLFVQWEVDLASTGTLSQFALATGEEFPGEGLVDTSP
jgi:hypothetical protein